MHKELRIKRVELFKLSIPLKEPFITSLSRDDYAKNVLVRIVTENGITGFGECSPYMAISGESQDTCFIVGQYFARLFKNRNALAIQERIDEMDKLIYGNNSIKSAFDMALYDIAAQHANLPLYALLGGRNDKTIATDYTVSIGDASEMAANALKIKNEGYPAIKVKLGQDGKADVARMKAIRHAVGDDIPLRIDANQGWTPDEAIETLKALAPLNIQHCEEPIPRWDYMNLPRIKKLSPIPIMADESCSDEHDAKRLLDMEACDYLNIKLGKAGGIFKALKIIEQAKQKNIHLQVGAFMESRLAMTAFAHFSLCSPLVIHFDFDTALMFSEDPVSGGIVYQKNGIIKIPETPGLGAWVENDTLKRFDSVTL